jgi:hypothetical protein
MASAAAMAVIENLAVILMWWTAPAPGNEVP